jgi:hypothetical protein
MLPGWYGPEDAWQLWSDDPSLINATSSCLDFSGKIRSNFPFHPIDA